MALATATDDLLAVRLPLRDRHSLADLYSPMRMPSDLAAAHRVVDGIVDALYGLDQPSTAEREAALFARYALLSSGAGV